MSDYSQEEEYARKRRLQKRRAKRRKEKILKHLIFGIVVAVAVVATVILLVLSGEPEEAAATVTDSTLAVSSAYDTSESRTDSVAAVTETVPDTSETTAAPETVTTAAEEVTASKEALQKGELVSNQKYSIEELEALSNKSVPYGNDWEDKDANGLANGIYYYESLYGQYGGYYRIKTESKTIYLTMDEGYEAGFTTQILDTLKEKNVKAVFFVTKQFYDYCQEAGNEDLIRRMIDEGHIVGNHTCRHPSGGYPLYVDTNGLDSFIEDISKLHRLIYDTYGYSMQLFRFPEGESSERLLACLENYDYKPVFWSYAHRDYVTDDQPAVETTLNRCLSHLAPGAIYLLHACSSSNTEALGDFIDSARALGYEFATFPLE